MSNRDTHYFVQSVPNYKDLLFFRKSVVLYDVTFAFCERYLTKGDRTIYIGVKEREFVEKGGIREAMTRARLQYRSEHPNGQKVQSKH